MTYALWTTGATLAIAGLILAAWALFGDRSRARRCRRCWYSMEGVPGLTCPECGWEAGRENVLTKPRRRWRRAIAGLVGVVVGAGLVLHGVARERPTGWWDLTPTRGLGLAVRLGDSPTALTELATRDLQRLSHRELRHLLERLVVLERSGGPGAATCREVRRQILTAAPGVGARHVLQLLRSDDGADRRLGMFLLSWTKQPEPVEPLRYATLFEQLSPGGESVPVAPPHPVIDPDAYSTELVDQIIGSFADDDREFIWAARLLAMRDPFDQSIFDRLIEARVAATDGRLAWRERWRVWAAVAHRPEGAAYVARFLDHEDLETRSWALIVLGCLADTSEPVMRAIERAREDEELVAVVRRLDDQGATRHAAVMAYALWQMGESPPAPGDPGNP